MKWISLCKGRRQQKYEHQGSKTGQLLLSAAASIPARPGLSTTSDPCQGRVSLSRPVSHEMSEHRNTRASCKRCMDQSEARSSAFVLIEMHADALCCNLVHLSRMGPCKVQCILMCIRFLETAHDQVHVWLQLSPEQLSHCQWLRWQNAHTSLQSGRPCTHQLQLPLRLSDQRSRSRSRDPRLCLVFKCASHQILSHT